MSRPTHKFKPNKLVDSGEVEYLKIPEYPAPTARARVGCRIDYLLIDADTHYSIIMVPDECVPNAVETIQTILKVDPDCREMLTYSGKVPDLVYKKQKGAGRWYAEMPKVPA